MKFENVIIWYLNIIEDLSEILKIVPYNSNNKSVIIPRLSPLIIESCSLLDTSFFSLFEGSKSKPDIRDYKKYYSNKSGLSSLKAFCFMDEGLIIQPFKEWENKDGKATLFWWRSYNNLKHDRINNMKESTLENAIYSIAALSIFIARDSNFVKPLYRHGLISSNINPDFIKSDFEKLWSQKYCEVYFENNLFLVPFGLNIIRESVHEINTYVLRSDRIRKFFARWG